MFGYDESEIEARGGGATAREIAQQPALWREVAGLVAGTTIEPGRRIVLTGAGSSAFAGEIVAPAIAQRTRARVDAVATTDIVATPRACFAEDVPTLLVPSPAPATAPRASPRPNWPTRC